MRKRWVDVALSSVCVYSHLTLIVQYVEPRDSSLSNDILHMTVSLIVLNLRQIQNGRFLMNMTLKSCIFLLSLSISGSM